MKKIFVIILAFAMVLTFTACNDKQNGTMEIEGDGTEFDLDTSDLDALLDDTTGEETYEDEADLGLEASNEYKGSVVNEKVDFSKIADMGEEYQEKFLEAANLIGTGWVPTYYYDDTEEEGIGEYLEVQGMEEDNEDMAFVQAGVYKNLDEDCYYQYLSYCSDSIYPTDDIDLTDAVSDLKTMFGVTVSQEKLEAAAQKVFDKVQEQGYFYSLVDTSDIEDSDYSESIIVSFEADYIDDETYMGYVYCSRERTYK